MRLGRLTLSYPELPADILLGRDLHLRRPCRSFSDCTTGVRQGLVSGCYPLDPHYTKSPEMKPVTLTRKAVKTG